MKTENYIPGWIHHHLPGAGEKVSSTPVSIAIGPDGNWRILPDDAPYDLHDAAMDGDWHHLQAFEQYLEAAAAVLPYHGLHMTGPHLVAALYCPALNIESKPGEE